MKTYLISYDLKAPRNLNDYTRLINTIKTANYWAKPLESVWLIKSWLLSAQIRDELIKVINKDDKLLVIEITDNWAAYGLSKDVVVWLQGGI